MNAMVALDRCRRAWERTSPQLVIDGWLDMLDELDGLDEAQPSALRLVEPARFHRTPPAGGLTAGAEPCCGPPMGLTASPAAADTGHRPALHGATASPVSSAPLQYDGPCRISPEEQRGGGQEGV